MTWQIGLFAALYLLTGLVSLIVAFICWRRRATPGGTSLAFLMLSVAIWSLTGALELLAIGIPAKVYWSKLQYVGITSGPVLLLTFALEYTQRYTWLTRRTLLGLWLIPILTTLFALTNEMHGLIWSSFTYSPTVENLLVYGHGWWFWVAVAYFYTLLSAGIVLLFQAVWRFRGMYRQQATMLFLASLIPMIGNVAYLFNLSPLPGLDFTPMVFAITGMLLGWNVFQFQFLDLAPIARDILIEYLGDGVLVVDPRERIIDINPAAQRLLDLHTPIMGRPLGQVAPRLADLPDDSESRTEMTLAADPLRWVDVRIVPLGNYQKLARGHLIVLRDITERKQMDAALQAANANLEIAVAARTAELRETVGELQNEIAERKRVEVSLRHMEETLAQRVADQSRQLAGLYDVILVAGQSLSVGAMQEQVLATIMDVMNCQAGCIHQWDARNDTLQLAAQRGLTAAMQLQIATIPTAWLLEDQIARAVVELAQMPGVPDAVRLPGWASFLGVPIHLRGKPTGTLGVFWDQRHSFSVEDIALFSAMADQLDIIVENARLRERSQAAAVAQERRRLARDLHDSVTQSLQSLVFSAHTATNRLKQGKLDRLELSLAQMAESARQALKEMRLLLYDLRLTSLDQVNMLEAIQLRLDAVEKRAGVDAELSIENSAPLPRVWENELYCIAMEALNNALKHSRATQVRVRVCGFAHGVELEIADNGKGIEAESVKPGGMGLGNMAERAERLGGSLTIVSEPGAGTRIQVRVEETA